MSIAVTKILGGTRITLARPEKLNALTLSMCQEIARAVAEASAAAEAAELAGATGAAGADPAAAIIIDGEGDRGFCAGGDVRQICDSPEATAEFLTAEYAMDLAVAKNPAVITVMHGITMGGGVGVGCHAGQRFVTETLRLAMPETKIGSVPDVGGTLLLARTPSQLGELLGVTGTAITAGDALALGFADHFLPEELRKHLTEHPDQLVGELSRRAADPHPDPQQPRSQLLSELEWLDPLLTKALGDSADPRGLAVEYPEVALRQLESELRAEPRAARFAQDLAQASPLAAAITLQRIAVQRRNPQPLEAVLAEDFRVFNLFAKTPDFQAGVTARLITKTGDPQWQTAKTEQLQRQQIARFER